MDGDQVHPGQQPHGFVGPLLDGLQRPPQGFGDGSAVFDLAKLREDATLEGIEAPILKDGKERGMMRFDVTFHPVLKPEIDSGGKELLPTDTSQSLEHLMSSKD